MRAFALPGRAGRRLRLAHDERARALHRDQPFELLQRAPRHVGVAGGEHAFLEEAPVRLAARRDLGARLGHDRRARASAVVVGGEPAVGHRACRTLTCGG